MYHFHGEVILISLCYHFFTIMLLTMIYYDASNNYKIGYFFRKLFEIINCLSSEILY